MAGRLPAEMTLTDWNYIAASVTGTSHTSAGLSCQDASQCSVLRLADGSPILVATAADGAGSATRSRAGADLACSLFLSEMTALFENGGVISDINREFAGGWLKSFQNEIGIRAEAAELTPRDFACTFLAAVIGSDVAAFIQIGDGAIVISSFKDPDDFGCVFWPQKGEFANMTTFATDEAALESFEHELVEQRIVEVAVFTDGLERLALKFDTQEAHPPFFTPMFRPLRSLPGGFAESLYPSFESFLDSKQVNDRTNDDKSLILATRRGIIGRPEMIAEANAQEETASL